MILQTQVPDDWDDVTLGGVLSYEQPTRYIVQSPIASEGEIPVLTPGKSLLLGYSEETFGRYDKVPIILFDDFTTSCQWVDYQFKVKSSACKILRARDESVNLRFMFELLKQINYVPADHKRHWISTFAKETVRIPAIEEQRAIASVLNDIDALIASLEQLRAKKWLIREGALEALTAQAIRLDGRVEPWGECLLGEIASLSSAPYKKPSSSSDGRYVIVDMGSVSRQGKLLMHKTCDSDQDLLLIGDLVMPKDDIGGGQIIGKTVLIDAPDRYVQGDHVYRLRLHREDPAFVHFVINSNRVNQRLLSKVVGSAQLGLGRQSVLKQPVPLPLLEEQQAIAEVLTDMDAEIEALEARLAKTRDLKTGMAQELLSGRTRLT